MKKFIIISPEGLRSRHQARAAKRCLGGNTVIYANGNNPSETITSMGIEIYLTGRRMWSQQVSCIVDAVSCGRAFDRLEPFVWAASSSRDSSISGIACELESVIGRGCSRSWVRQFDN